MQAEGILAGYTRTVAQISGDDRLTPEAKAVDLAKAYTKAQTDLSGVRATVEQQEAETSSASRAGASKVIRSRGAR